MATSSHITSRAARRRTIVLLTLLAFAGAACTAAVAAGTQHSRRPAPTGGYNWPIKPFDQPHPVRGAFGDPRTSFIGPPTRAGLNSKGEFAYHFGVDIWLPTAPRSTPSAPASSTCRAARPWS